jgi:dihydrofolate synthase / folylpolyglutamate synthase
MEVEKEYQQALDYLYSFVDYSLTRGFQFSPEKFNLDRMFNLLAVLGNPHTGYPIIHVAGSKGKGSVAAMCASVLKKAGYRVGFYTSPHLHDYCERIQVNGQQIRRSELVALVAEVKPAVAMIPELTTFEITTALGFLYFTRNNVNAAVIEVGLGGRLDATNVVSPVVSVITSISYDHLQVLGDTLAKIAAEKGGIIKPGIPVVSAPQKDEVTRVLEELAGQRGSRLIQVGRDFGFRRQAASTGQAALDVQVVPEKQVFYDDKLVSTSQADQTRKDEPFKVDQPDLSGQTVLVWKAKGPDKADPDIQLRDTLPIRLRIPLLGSHQVENAATAYTALQVFCMSGYVIPEDAFYSGFGDVYWPGRFEILDHSPMLLVDSAHNRDSARRLRETLEEYFPGYRITMIFGVSEDKDVEGMFLELLPQVDRIIATRSFHPRAMESEELARIAVPFGKPVQAVNTVEQAVESAAKSVVEYSIQGGRVMILATGSLFIAAAVREIWLSQHGRSVARVFSNG